MSVPGAGWHGLSRARVPSAGFKDELHEEHPDLLPAWYAFTGQPGPAAVHVQWLADNALIDDGAANSSFRPPGSCPALTPADAATRALSCRTWCGFARALRRREAGAVSGHDELHRTGAPSGGVCSGRKISRGEGLPSGSIARLVAWEWAK